MINISNIKTKNWEDMINRLHSFDNIKSDSKHCTETDWDCMGGCPISPCIETPGFIIGQNDWELIKVYYDKNYLLRAITVSMDVNAPMYWWHQMPRYGTRTFNVRDIATTKLTLDDFSIDGMDDIALSAFSQYVDYINSLCSIYQDGFGKYESHDIGIYNCILKMMPISYNQSGTWTSNYAILKYVYRLIKSGDYCDEWKVVKDYIECLPYANELIIER